MSPKAPLAIKRWILPCAAAIALAALTLSASNALPTYGAAQTQYLYTQQGRISESETADFNCDNRPDVILSNGLFQSGQNWPVNIALTNGTGGFVDGTTQIFGGTPVARSEHLGKILIEDYNGDGRPDIFIADSGIDGFPYTGRQNTLILSTPDCHLVDATANLPQQSDFTHSATTGDVDNDGDVDLYVGNIWGANLIPPQIWLNDGTGHFTVGTGLLPAAQTNLDLNRYTTSLLVDVNNDGNIDLVLGGENNTLESVVLLNDGAGHFTKLANALPAKPFASDPLPSDAVSNALPMDVKSSDFNHDGFADLAFEFTKWSPYYQGRWIQLLRNNGNGTFTDETATRLFPTQTNNLLTWLLFVHFVDLDGDGNRDLIGEMIGTNGDNHRFYLADASGVFTETAFLAGQLGDVFGLVDARGDGHRDVLNTANIGNDQHRVSLLSDTGPVLAPGIPQKVRPTRNLVGHVRVWWPYVWGATSYEVWRSATAGGAGSLLLDTVSATSFDDTTLTAGATAYYRIRAVNSAATSDYSIAARGSSAVPTAPTVVTLAATSVTASGATLNATVNPKGASTTALFEYGTTTAYGSQIAASPAPGAGNSAVSVSAAVAGLGCNTPYHFRISATSAGGTPNGLDVALTTAVCPPTLAPVSNVITRINTPRAVSIALGGGASGPGSLTLSGSSSNPTLVPNANLVFSGSGANRTLTITPAANKRGVAPLTVTARDTNNATATISFVLQVEVPQSADFDGDRKADIAVFRPSNGIWYVRRSSDGAGVFNQWGLAGDIPVPADYDGDGRIDVAVFRPSTGIWYIQNSATNSLAFLQWGLTGDIPAPGDYDGDGKADAAVFRPSTGIWYVRDLATNTATFYQWGLNSDTPVAADYDGDGKTDVAVYRPSTGIWYIRNSSDNSTSFLQWGITGDVPVPGDYDGDGKADSAVFRPSTNIWYVRNLSTNTASFYLWGLPGDIQAPGDYDGDGKTDVAVFRPSTGFFYIWYVGSGTFAYYSWGIGGDIPVLMRQ